jgi:signal transduction histidine kinase
LERLNTESEAGVVDGSRPSAPATVAEDCSAPLATARPSRLLVRGESVIAQSGILLCAVLLIATAASCWWTYKVQLEAVASARREQVRAVETLLWQSAEVMLAQDEVSAVRRLVNDASHTYNLQRCRIVLPNNAVIAASETSQINLAKLPPTWSDAPMTGGNEETGNHSLIMLSHPLKVPGRGSARLELAAPIQYPVATILETQAGVAAIGVAALISLLLVYRGMRSRLRAMGAIREALLALSGGERTLAALAVGPDLGPEAIAWNELLLDKDKLAASVALTTARQTMSDRRVNKGDLDAAFDAMSQGLVLVNEKLQARFVNGAAAVFLQARREEMVGSDVSRFIKYPEVMKAIEGVAAGTVRRRMTIEVKQQDLPGGEGGATGAAGVLKFSVRPVRREDSAAAMVIIEDVTQQRVADEARNAFVAQATHELRTPLTNIRLYVETAIDEGEESPAVRAKALNVINQEVRRLEHIVGEMLSVSEIEAGSFKLSRAEVRLDALFAELQADYEAQAGEKQLRFKVNLPPKLPAIKGDREKISVALHNLVGNAMKYTPAGGQVTVNVSIDQSMLTVDVVDTGLGISEQDQKQIFDKFYRAKDPRIGHIPGTGLGLTLAREVIRLHGGDIGVQSQIDKGSTFTLTLPVSVEAV